MRRLAALVAVFAIVSSNAWAFDPYPEFVGQMYFSIPIGAATKQEATPRLGFRVGYSDGLIFDDRNARMSYSVVDWQSNLNGRTTLLINGVDVAQLSRVLYAAEDEGQTDGEVALIVLGIGAAIGVLVYVAVQTEDCLDNIWENC